MRPESVSTDAVRRNNPDAGDRHARRAATHPPIIGRDLPSLTFAWTTAAAFLASLLFFLYSYFVRFDATGRSGDWVEPTLFNLGLFSAFALHHSVFARSGLKKRVSDVISPSLERTVYTLVSSVLFALTCGLWRDVPGVVYALSSPWHWLACAVVTAGLVITAQSARALDVLDLAGVRQVLNSRAAASRPPTPLRTDGLYGFVRHPVYFGWVLIVFGAPSMTLTRLSFAVISTLYLAVAVPFEERSLIETFGPDYASYRERVRWRMIPGIY
jgi:methanethiol S-methyltransferase